MLWFLGCFDYIILYLLFMGFQLFRLLSDLASEMDFIRPLFGYLLMISHLRSISLFAQFHESYLLTATYLANCRLYAGYAVF